MTLRLSDVSKSFGGTAVLRDVSLEVGDGTRLALVGASGSGKTTLLRLIAGFERPDAGTITLGGRLLAGPETAIPAHRRRVGYVAQDGALFPHLSVGSNIGFGLARSGARGAVVRELMELVSLDPSFADRMPHQLSGGQQQRVALARALAQRPEAILLDEPFSALDTGLRAATRAAVVEVLERSGVTAVLVTHDQEEALTFGQQVGVLVAGRLVQSGEPADVFDAPADAHVAQFLGEAVFVPAERAGQGRAECAFGPTAVRHDASGGAAAVRAMVRPAQLRVELAPEGLGNGTILDVRRSGAAVDLHVRAGADDAAALIVHRTAPHIGGRFDTGSAVRVSVDGGVVLYPA
ncbi:MAG: ABC transporter ATP-binding protein [Microbacterium sp.]